MTASHIHFSDLFQWDRYGQDALKFSTLIDDIAQPNPEQLSVLFLTFSDEDDFGLQECVMRALDRADDDEFACGLVSYFSIICEHAMQQEWPWLILGRYINAENIKRLHRIEHWIAVLKHSTDTELRSLFTENALQAVSLENRKSSAEHLQMFLQSDDFNDEYPEYGSLCSTSIEKQGFK